MSGAETIVAADDIDPDCGRRAQVTDRSSPPPKDLQREPGDALVALGAGGLLASLFMLWFGRVSGWNAFEVWDLLLAALAAAALVAVPSRLGFGPRRPDWWLWASSAGTLIIVVENLINRPPIIQLASAVAGARPGPGVGMWVALAAGVTMLAGTALCGAIDGA